MSSILAFKPGHDGHIAHVHDGELIFSIEAEKDSGHRYGEIHTEMVLELLEKTVEFSDIIALSGWSKGRDPRGTPIGAGYLGPHSSTMRESRFLGRQCNHFSDSHERAHLFATYALSPYPQGQPCYALIWEGHIGSFYFIDDHLQIHSLGTIQEDPGIRYAFAFGVADPSFHLPRGQVRLGDAGKMMALSAFGQGGTPSAEEQRLLNYIMEPKSGLDSLWKQELNDSAIFNAGVESQVFKDFARKLSDAIFDRFLNFAETRVKRGFPLLLGGGCALNCEWNTKWGRSELFSDVFIPPCPNDSGVAIGTAADAQFQLTGNAKLRWDVYSGENFRNDVSSLAKFNAYPFDQDTLCKELDAGKVFGWVQGKYEIGPRALGNRSIIASAQSPKMLSRLNTIKQRESYRPIAPICREENARDYFTGPLPSPYMLYFQTLKTTQLPAITHVDSSTRVQTVTQTSNPKMWSLLSHYQKHSGVSVLCNTSLNFKGKGFINTLSDLGRFACDRDLDGFVVDNKIYLKESN